MRQCPSDSHAEAQSEPLMPFGEVVRAVGERARALLSAGAAGVMLLNPDSWELECQYPAFQLQPHQVREFRVPLTGETASARVVRTGQAYLTHDAPNDQNLIPHYVRMCRTRNMVSCKLHWQGAPVGVVHVTNKQGQFTPEDSRSLDSVTALFASMLVHARQQDALRRLHDLPQRSASLVGVAPGCEQMFTFLVQEIVRRLSAEAATIWVQLAPGGPLHRLASSGTGDALAIESVVALRTLQQVDLSDSASDPLGIPLGIDVWPRGVLVVRGATKFNADRGLLDLVDHGIRQEAVIWAQRELLRAVATNGLTGLCMTLEDLLGMPAAVRAEHGLYQAISRRFAYPSRLPRNRGESVNDGGLASYAICRGEERLGALLLWPPAGGSTHMQGLAALLDYAATLGAAVWPTQFRLRNPGHGPGGELEALLAGRESVPVWLQEAHVRGSAVLAVAAGVEVAALADHCRSIGSRCSTVGCQDHDVLVVAAPDPEAVVQHLRQAAERRVHVGGMPVIVVDDATRSAENMAASYRQCQAGMHLVRSLGRAGVYPLSLLGPARLLLDADLRELRRLLSKVRCLQGEPPEKSVILAQTYIAFADAGENAERASAALHVHRNTLHYRLSKLEDLGISHENVGARLTLYMALRLFIFLQGIQTGEVLPGPSVTFCPSRSW